ncbi:MAG: dienelactone hydrolase family protein [Gammaproteobacteria bacterium]|nr:dienelactone hydrolase family protein [Gammaproteobacteria bacterium]
MKVLLLPLLLLLAGCAPTRHYEAALVLQDIAAEQGDSRLKQIRPAPLRQAVTYSVSGRPHSADLYLPGPLEGCTTRCPRAAIVAVPGAVPLAKDDPRLVAFATSLARAGFAVLAPEMPGFRQMRVRPSDAQEIADAFRYLASRPELSPDGRAGMFAFSYAVGPALLAALQDDIRDRVRFVVGLGGYHDLPRAMRFFTTGWFEHAGEWRQIIPDDTGRMVLVYASLDYLADAREGAESDRARFERMVELRGRDPQAELTPLAAGLSAQGKAVYALAVNGDPARFPELLAGLPEAMRADMERLNLARHDLKQLQARLLLVHGRNDNLIPYPESLALAAAVPEGQAKVFLIHRVLGHVDLSFSSLFSWRFWSEDLPDLWRLWRVIDLLLAEREAA